jgi:hypothetical protein
MARGFAATLGVATTDVITAGSFVSPTIYSFAGWYNRNGAGGLSAGRIFDKTGSAAGEIQARWQNTSTALRILRQFSVTAGQWESTDAAAVAANQWVHIVVAYDGGLLTNVPTLYINGRAATVSTLTTPVGTLTSAAGVYTIGNRSTSGTEWDGMLGDQAFWSGVMLTQAEANALFMGADPRTIRANYLAEMIRMGTALPSSAIKSTQPIITGTKFRQDRQLVQEATRLAFTAAPAAQPAPLGFFDSDLVNAAWFDPDTQVRGWFDDDLVIQTGPTNQTLTPSLFQNANTFFTHTVTPGAVNLSPSLFTNSNGFFTQTVASAYALTPALFTNANSFFTHVVTPGAVNLSPSLFTNSNSFYTHTVTPGAVNLAPALFSNANTFYGPTVSATYALTPSLFTNSNTFYSATVTPGPVNLSPSLFTNANTFYSATVSLASGAQDLAPSLFSNANSFFTHTVTAGAVNLAPALFTNSNSFFAHTLSASYTLSPPLFTNANSFFAPTVQANYALIASLFGNTNTFFSPTVAGGAQTLSPSLFSNANTFFGHQITSGAHVQYPLAGIPEIYELAGTSPTLPLQGVGEVYELSGVLPTYPLAGIKPTYPLG